MNRIATNLRTGRQQLHSPVTVVTASEPAGRMNDCSDQIPATLLHPASIITFLLGLPRQVDERVLRSVGATDPTQAIDAIRADLEQAIDVLADAGHAPFHPIGGAMMPSTCVDPARSRLHAVPGKLARLVAGVPARVWAERPELLQMLQHQCARVADRLAEVGPADAEEASRLQLLLGSVDIIMD